MYEINPFDIASGKVVQNDIGTYWFKEPGNNVVYYGWPIYENLHRDNDLPAVIWANGKQEWYKNGKLHRDNGPALIWPDGTRHWYKNGKWHRDNGPAIIESDGTKKWYKDDCLHRDGDQPAVILANGSQAWYKNGKHHRDNGPAVIWGNGKKFWYKNGEEMSLWDRIKSWFQK